MLKQGTLVLCISNEFGVPIYNARIRIVNKDFKTTINTNLCGITTLKLEHGEYIITVTANEYKGRKFKVKFYEKCSFLSFNLRFMSNKIFGYILDDFKGESLKINLLYEVSEGTYIKVNECKCDEQGKYVFYNIPRGHYKVKAEKE
ncbi:hypothetical protein [uncultured Clostridium sp.]|jgi:hypothetical protein|uniref:hypothetical protein n=1 Tax=uncultured Clostridium sp. TaxID=59620 RepID=UPI002604175D|nr:hypothetical protein [uncultured Clostridium sp.]